MFREDYLGKPLTGVSIYRPHVRGTGGAVSSNNPYVSSAALQILKKGGNAADAAAAASLVLGVVEPFNSGIGGGAFSLCYQSDTKKFCAYNGRGEAPRRAWTDMFLDEDGQPDPELTEFSGRSTAAPALYRVIGRLLSEQGTMTLKEVSEPAINLARNGFYAGFLYQSASSTNNAMYCAEHYEGFTDLYWTDGKPRTYGDFVKNPELADTMEQVAENGIDWFYQGPIAKEMVEAVQKHKGVLEMEDLAGCRAKDLDVVKGTYRGHDIISVAPPSSGGAHIIQALNILQNFDLRSMGFLSADSIHVIAETMKIMFADRSIAMGDPEFVDVQLDKIIDPAYAKELAQKIDMNRAQNYMPDPSLAAQDHNGCTTHFSVQDKDGNIVCQTQTIRNWWGCGVVIPGRGFVMNNAMADFSAKAGVRTSQGLAYGTANAVQPKKVPLSSMCPTIVLKDSKPLLSVGAAGGPRIITATLQLILNVIDYEMMMDVAVRAPHICCLSQDQGLELEAGVSPDSVQILRNRGHKALDYPSHAILKELSNGILKLGEYYYPGGTSRAEGGGGILTGDNKICIDGFCFENCM